MSLPGRFPTSTLHASWAFVTGTPGVQRVQNPHVSPQEQPSRLDPGSSMECANLEQNTSPVIENGQLECPQGYKRLNLTHCQGRTPRARAGLRDAGVHSQHQTGGVSVTAQVVSTKPSLGEWWGATGSRGLRKSGDLLESDRELCGAVSEGSIPVPVLLLSS
ncbi:hypothetical protein P7K49_018316 [Saguinus oedipus]|uniref:Uncharacterized protein n=1 Tax=Saguinus oedipus TaxID=9490 RepID=A0ABQ9V611_SAGOE|nr:hypothetical protein P7K49_018316 [Saguinus oedipus]